MDSSLNLINFNAPALKPNIQSLSRVLKKSSSDEKKNLSKHHLILPNNTQICVETLLSQCVNEEQIDRKFDIKLRARLKKRKLALFKPKNFILKNGRLRPIVTTNIKSGVFRAVQFVNQKRKNNMHLVPSNVLYSQSTLPSRIQLMNDFCNDEWVVERTTQYMPNDWTRPLILNGNASQEREILEYDYDKRPSRIEPKVVSLRNRNEYAHQFYLLFHISIFPISGMTISWNTFKSLQFIDLLHLMDSN